MKTPGTIAILITVAFLSSAFGDDEGGSLYGPDEDGYRNVGHSFSLGDLAHANSKWGFIDRTGKVVVEPKYATVRDFSEGLASVKVPGPGDYGGKCGFIDTEGRVVIRPKYVFRTVIDGLLEFRGGLAMVQVESQGDKFGVIDPTGAMVIEPRYMYFYGVRYSEADDAVTGYHWDPDTNESVATEFDPSRSYHMAEGLIKVRSGTRDDGTPRAGADRYGFADQNGRLVIRPQFEDVGEFSEGLAKFAVDVNWDGLDKAGDFEEFDEY